MKKTFFKPQFSFRMSRFHSVRDTTPKPLELFYEDRLNMMRDKIKTQILCDTEFFTRPNIVSSSKLLKKEDMNVFSLAVYPQGKTRGREAICGMSGLVLDFDHPDERFQYPEDILKTYSKSPCSAFAAVLVYDSVVGLSETTVESCGSLSGCLFRRIV
ncbi:hypothetical protein Bealeia1_00177 [Candidatus Bealeia paramacronuclearis]|uniref:Uncharacterized protein n=2 Tax=Candidatus Bealeia paramacronuclearis TaxID=1921001 RepID=A0ABZ2C158_9PROT